MLCIQNIKTKKHGVERRFDEEFKNDLLEWFISLNNLNPFRIDNYSVISEDDKLILLDDDILRTFTDKKIIESMGNNIKKSVKKGCSYFKKNSFLYNFIGDKNLDEISFDIIINKRKISILLANILYSKKRKIFLGILDENNRG